MISVLLPLYNNVTTLDDSLESLMKQTVQDFEIIAIDNNSTDGTAEAIRRWMNKDSRIKMVFETEKGIDQALNCGIRHARGEWIARMDADDLSEPTRFEKQLKFMGENPEIDICGTQIRMFGGKEKTSDYSLSHEAIVIDLCFRNCIAHPTVMFRRERMPDFNYETGYPMAGDYRQWIKLCDRYRFGNLNETLLQYRVHPKQCMSSNTEEAHSSEQKMKQMALLRFGIQTKEEEASVHHQFSRHMTLKSSGEFWQECRTLTRLWKASLSDANDESKQLQENHWNRLLNAHPQFRFSRTWAHCTSGISQNPLALWRKGKREKINKLLN
jgi:glycosyltransferase involved in cell wall biosynthesis